MYDLFEKVANVAVPDWSDSLLSVSSDGARHMTSCTKGTVSLFRRNLSPDRKMLRTWCGAHQLYLVFQKAFSKLCDDTFYHKLTGLTGYHRRQFNFITEVSGNCRKVATKRVLSPGGVLK